METKENSNTWVDIDFAFPFSHFWDSFHESSWTIGAELYFEWTFTYAWNLEQLSFTPTPPPHGFMPDHSDGTPHNGICGLFTLFTDFAIRKYGLEIEHKMIRLPPLRSLLFSFYLFPHQCRVFLSLIIKVFLLTNK